MVVAEDVDSEICRPYHVLFLTKLVVLTTCKEEFLQNSVFVGHAAVSRGSLFLTLQAACLYFQES